VTVPPLQSSNFLADLAALLEQQHEFSERLYQREHDFLQELERERLHRERERALEEEHARQQRQEARLQQFALGAALQENAALRHADTHTSAPAPH
jgi:hypothetical protein